MTVVVPHDWLFTIKIIYICIIHNILFIHIHIFIMMLGSFLYFFLVVLWLRYCTVVIKEGEWVIVIAVDNYCYYYYIDHIICDHRSIEVVSSLILLPSLNYYYSTTAVYILLLYWKVIYYYVTFKLLLSYSQPKVK